MSVIVAGRSVQRRNVVSRCHCKIWLKLERACRAEERENRRSRKFGESDDWLQGDLGFLESLT